MNRRAVVVGVLIGALLQLAAPAQAAPPSNDNFASAVDLGSAVPAAATGFNIDATVEAGEPLARNGSEASGTIWWRWTAPETARYRVDLCATQPVFTATLAVFAGDNVAALTRRRRKPRPPRRSIGKHWLPRRRAAEIGSSSPRLVVENGMILVWPMLRRTPRAASRSSAT